MSARPSASTVRRFFNLVAAVHSDESPASIDHRVRAIEDRLGRTRDGERFSDRRIDIDLLSVGHLVMSNGGVRIPRDDIIRYAFVLKPLHDVAAEWIHPVRCVSVDVLWRAMRATDPAASMLERVDEVLDRATC